MITLVQVPKDEVILSFLIIAALVCFIVSFAILQDKKDKGHRYKNFDDKDTL